MLGLLWLAYAAADPSSPATALIQTCGTVAAAGIAAVGAVYGARAHREARAAKVEARGAHANAYAANHAVNCVEEGTPTLVQRVARLEGRIEAIARHVGAPDPED